MFVYNTDSLYNKFWRGIGGGKKLNKNLILGKKFFFLLFILWIGGVMQKKRKKACKNTIDRNIY